MKDYAQTYEELDLDPTMPPIDHRLWTYREVVTLIVEREQGPSRFHSKHYCLYGELYNRVFEIRDWLKKNRFKFPCLEGFNDGVTLSSSSKIALPHVLQIPTSDYGDIFCLDHCGIFKKSIIETGQRQVGLICLITLRSLLHFSQT